MCKRLFVQDGTATEAPLVTCHGKTMMHVNLHGTPVGDLWFLRWDDPALERVWPLRNLCANTRQAAADLAAATYSSIRTAPGGS